MSVTYTILKQPGSICGLPTGYSLNILAEPGLSYSGHQILQMDGNYVTEIRIDYNELGTGGPVTISLCDNVPTVCPPESVILTITTNVIDDPEKTDSESIDYGHASVGGGHQPAASA